MAVGAVVGAYGFPTAIALLAVLYAIDLIALMVLIPERKGAELV